MYHKFLLATVGAVALTGSAAIAADLPSRQPAPVYLPPVPIFTWTGVYLGGQIGYAWGRDKTNFTTIDPDRTFFPADTSPQGVIGGAHIGYNLQISQWVIGLEGSVDGASMSKTVSLGGQPGFLHLGHPPLTVDTRAEIQGSIRARAGIAFDRVLLFATGGAAFTGIKNNYWLGAPFFLSENISKTRAGWTVGGGVEYAVTNNWSVRAEYRYSDFGRFTDFPFVALASLPAARHHLTESQVQVGFSYKFDSLAPAPVVARY
jgi:outer membrane immunogenic protein